MSKSSAWSGALAAADSAKKVTRIDEAAEQKSDRQRAKKGHLRLSKIKDRELSTRALNGRHVASLAESIAELGLIQSIAVDQDGILLAGGHRLAAIRMLRETRPDFYAKWFEDDLVPVTTIALDDADDRERQALAIELSENEKRRDYTKGEIQQVADRLRQAGYRDGQGRLPAGEKHLVPALALVLGKSLRTARRLMASSIDDVPPSNPSRSTVLALQRCERAIQFYLQLVTEAPAAEVHRTFYDAVKHAEALVGDAIESEKNSATWPNSSFDRS